MKTKLFMYVMLVFCMSITVSAQKKSSSERKKMEAEKVSKEIESGRFKIDANQALPMGSRMISLTSSYFLEFRGDTVVSELPYYGRAYSAPMNMSGGGISFKEVAKSIKKRDLGKKGVQIDVEVKAPDDTYRFSIRIFSNGESDMGVTSNNRSFISFRGRVAIKE